MKEEMYMEKRGVSYIDPKIPERTEQYCLNCEPSTMSRERFSLRLICYIVYEL